MKNIKFLIFLSTTLLFAYSCKKDMIEEIDRSILTPVMGTVSGTAFWDISGDGIGEEPMTLSQVYLGDSLILSDPNWYFDSIAYDAICTIVDDSGNFSFEGVPPLENQVIRIFPNAPFADLTGMDNTADGDENEELNNEIIQIVIDTDELDDGNDFIAYKIPVFVSTPSISGYVLIDDDDGDLLGDGPAVDHIVQLYQRNDQGVPMGSMLGIEYSDSNGYFEFTGIDVGEYVLYHIGTGDYIWTCVTNMDISPELGEPAADAGCQFIPVNLTSEDEEDSDNVFVIALETVGGPGQLSGSIFEDITSDGQPDELTDLIITVEIYERDVDGFATGPVLYSTMSNPNATFIIENIDPGSYVVSLDDSTGDFNTIYGASDSGGAQPLPDVFPIDVSPGQVISNAYFWIYTNDNIPVINGSVSEDLDGDGVGDTPQFDHTVELYLRGADDLPLGDYLYKTNTTSNGMFFFTNLNWGNYVLKLTGPAEFSCVNSGDATPEFGEPTSSPGCEYIPVDITSTSLDEDNFYTVEQ